MSDLPEELRGNHSKDYLSVYKDTCSCQYCRAARCIENLERTNEELLAELKPWRELIEKLEKAESILRKKKPPPDTFIGSTLEGE